MHYTELEQVRVKTWGCTIGTVEKIIFTIVDEKVTEDVYYYEMEINGQHGIIVYPDEIDE